MHDGAANIKDAGSENGWLDVGCSAHKLHLVVTSATGIDKTSNSTISRYAGATSHLVGHFNHRTTATTTTSIDGQQPSVTQACAACEDKME